MSLTRHASIFAKLTALWVGVAAAVLALCLAATGFFVAAFYIWLTAHFAPMAATSITGGALVVLAAATGLTGSALLRRARCKQRAERTELIGTAALFLRLASTLIRRDPKKAVILALLAGAVAEFFMGET